MEPPPRSDRHRHLKGPEPNILHIRRGTSRNQESIVVPNGPCPPISPYAQSAHYHEIDRQYAGSTINYPGLPKGKNVSISSEHYKIELS